MTGLATDAGPDVGEVLRVLSLQAGFNSAVVVIGATLLGIASGTVGTFALLRKRALMGDALAHATLPGIALAFLVSVWLGAEGKSLPVLLLGATVTGVLGVVAVHLIVRHSRLREDAAIGAVLSTFFGAGIVLLSYIQTLQSGNQGGLHHFIYGQTAAMSRSDAILIGAVALGAALTAGAVLKEFRLVCFDDQFAAVQGWPVQLIDLLMMALVVVVTVIGLQAVGLVLVIALLIIPPAAARFWTDKLGLMTLLGAGIGGLSGYLGSVASALLPRLPAGSVIVLTAGSLFALSLLLAPSRGLVARSLRHTLFRLRIDRQNLLRAIYESLESGRHPAGVPTGELLRVRTWSAARLALLLTWLTRRGLVTRRAGIVVPTDLGRAEAARVTRNHRLWEEYLLSYADLAASHVDRAADMVEHVLSEPLIAELERELRRRGRLPTAAPVGPLGARFPIAPSVHPIPPPTVLESRRP